MFKPRTTKPVQRTVQQKKQVLTRKGRIQSFGDFPSGTPDKEEIIINGKINVQTKITLQSYKNVTFKYLKMNDNSENTIEFVGESLKFISFINEAKTTGDTSLDTMNIYVKSSKEKTNDEKNRDVMINIPKLGGNSNPVINWYLFADSNTFSAFESDSSDNMAPHVIVTKNTGTPFDNDNIEYIYSGSALTNVPNDSKFSYLEATLVEVKKDKAVDGTDIWYNMIVDSSAKTITVEVFSDEAKTTSFTGDIYYPFRTRGTNTINLLEVIQETVPTATTVVEYTTIYSNNVHFTDESADDEITINETIKAADSSTIEFIIKKSVKMVSEFDKNNNAETKIIRYNANTYTVAKTDNGTTTYPEKPADEWVIDTSVQFNDGNIKYESGNSSISSKLEVEGGYSGYIFGEPKLTIEPTGQLTVGTAVLESKRTNLPVYGDATYYNLILTGISTLDIQEGKNEENQPICGKISCGEFIL